MNKQFENFLNDKKEDFCKWFCKYNNFEKTKIETNEDAECVCPFCDKEWTEEFTDIYVDVNLCKYCQIENFIREIRDSKNIKVE